MQPVPTRPTRPGRRRDPRDLLGLRRIKGFGGIRQVASSIVLAGAVAVGVGGCGALDAGSSSGTSAPQGTPSALPALDRPPGNRTALAIDGATWLGPTRISVGTECAMDLVVTVGADHGGSDLPEVTIWGRPRAGRCHPTVTVRLPRRTAKIVDGTTSEVITLPAR